MGAVGTAVVTKAAAGIVAGSSWIANKGSQLYDKGKQGLETLKWGSKSPSNAKIVAQNSIYKHGQKVAEEFADFFFGNNGDPKEYLKDKVISNSLIKTFERMTQTKVKTCNEQKLNQISQQSAPTKSGVKSNPYDLLKERGINSTLDDIDREVLDSGNWRMQYQEATKASSE